jgi:hypothetical protein
VTYKNRRSELEKRVTSVRIPRGTTVEDIYGENIFLSYIIILTIVSVILQEVE